MPSHSHSSKVIIFDWDDTICPSSFVDQWKIENSKDLPLHFQNLFYEVAKCAEKCLREAAKYGEVIIITNSDDGWVKFSAERFVPQLLPCLEQCRIVSARTRYERFYPNQPLCWKAAAFAHEVNEIYKSEDNFEVRSTEDDITSSVSTGELESSANTTTSSLTDDFGSVLSKKKVGHSFSRHNRKGNGNGREVISFGDSMEERTAVRIVANQLKATPKSVMFINSPTPIQIIGQLNMITDYMDYVCNQRGLLDLEISRRQAIKAAEEFLYEKPHCKSSTPVTLEMKYNGHQDQTRSRLRTNDMRIASNQNHP